ncbi:MAG: hypothetical protein ABI669_16435 [Usitatibacter sp.]
MADTPTKSQAPTAPKLPATKTPPPELVKGDAHEERAIDEGLDESFPASDPPSSSTPGSTAAVKHTAENENKAPKP